jgi:hypothetical protein
MMEKVNPWGLNNEKVKSDRKKCSCWGPAGKKKFKSLKKKDGEGKPLGARQQKFKIYRKKIQLLGAG